MEPLSATLPAVSQSVSVPVHTSSSSSPSFSSIGTATTGKSHAPSSCQLPPGMPNIPVTPGPPGIPPSIPLAPNVTIPSSLDSSASNMTIASSMDSSSSSSSAAAAAAFPRPTMQIAPVLPNHSVLQQGNASYPSVPPMVAPLQGLWLQPPQVGGILRPPFTAYPASFTIPCALPPRVLPVPSVPSHDTQPPGVTSSGTPSGNPTLSATSSSQSTSATRVQPKSSGTDDTKSVIDIKDCSMLSEELASWTAHRTETGAVYYYNALTGESTYEKPAGFKGEPEHVTAQPTPVSWEKLVGTDWALVTTNDGKRYYCNTKTKSSSWQIPSEVTELKKKQDADVSKAQSMSVTNTNELTEKGSTPISLSAPAVNTGGRDATALRPTGLLGQSSALDLIKKKLQDSGTPPTMLPAAASSVAVSSELNGTKIVEGTVRAPESENSKGKLKDTNGESNLSDSSSDSEDDDGQPTKEACIIQFKEMLKERGVAPFSKWEKELPKIVFDPRFKAIPSHSARRALFEHYVKTRAEEERKEKRAAQKAAVEGFKKLLEEAEDELDHNTDYQIFKKKWGNDPRFQALERREREVLLHERVFPLKKVAEEKAQAARAAAISGFKSMIREKGDVTPSSRWSKVKDSLRNDPRYKCVKHEDREVLFNEYISELKAAEEEMERALKDKHDEEEKLKERERTLRKRKEREEQEVERVRLKARRKEAVESYQALLVETIKDPQASWTESKSKLEKDPQGRASNPHLDLSDMEKLFREHVKMLHERCTSEFRALLAEAVTVEAAARETEDGKTVFTSWSTAKQLLKADSRYTKMPRKERESLWRRHVEELQRRQKLALDQEIEKHAEAKNRIPVDSGKNVSGSRRAHERR